MNEKAFFLRIGSNKEKQYLEKTGALFSGFIVKANFFESSPGMLSGLFLKFSKEPLHKNFIIDPVSYVYTLNPDKEWSIRSWQKIKRGKEEKKLREDLFMNESEEIPLDWIREIQGKVLEQEDKVEIRGIKRAFHKLAEEYFSFDLNILSRIGRRALNILDLTSSVSLDKLVERTINYQINAISSKYDPIKYADFLPQVPKPSLVLCPYFKIENDEWLELNTKLWSKFTDQYTSDNGALVILTNQDFLKKRLGDLIKKITSTSINHVILWLDGFEEDEASEDALQVFARLVVHLSKANKKVINLYSGGFSSFLLPFGLHGIVNNPGYGMQRDFEPVIGGLPQAQFYIPSNHTRQSVWEAFKLLDKHGIGNTADDFWQRICNCPICKEGIQNGYQDIIQYYGELGPSRIGKDGIAKRFPTNSALERCNYHFIFSRLIEFRNIKKMSKEGVIELLESEIRLWGDSAIHLKRWLNVLLDLV